MHTRHDSHSYNFLYDFEIIPVVAIIVDISCTARMATGTARQTMFPYFSTGLWADE